MITPITHDGKIVGIWTDLDVINNEVLRDIGNCSQLKFIATPCTGTDHIKVTGYDIIYLDEKWRSEDGKEVTSTAEHTWSLILQLAKLKRMQLYKKCIGIIGLGRIGTRVSTYSDSFGMDRHIFDKDSESKYLEVLLRESDIITLHVPLNDKTKGMIGKEQLEMMKPGAMLINTSRPSIVDKNSLIEALYSGHLGGYADDFSNVRMIFHENVIQTPHIGGNCIEAREATEIYIHKKVNEYIRERFHEN
jgi:D-3-phosphoglycerate dehydrogenase